MKSLGISARDQGADATVGEDFEKYRVKHSTIENRRAGNATLQSFDAAAYFGNHAVADRLDFDQLASLFRAQPADHAPFRVLHALDVRQQDELLGV